MCTFKIFHFILKSLRGKEEVLIEKHVILVVNWLRCGKTGRERCVCNLWV